MTPKHEVGSTVVGSVDVQVLVDTASKVFVASMEFLFPKGHFHALVVGRTKGGWLDGRHFSKLTIRNFWGMIEMFACSTKKKFT
jgi:hypothetical protein